MHIQCLEFATLIVSWHAAIERQPVAEQGSVVYDAGVSYRGPIPKIISYI